MESDEALYESPLAGRRGESTELDEGAEENPDWSQLYDLSRRAKKDGRAVEAFIPRRGDKDFAPEPAFSDRQTVALRESRDALFSALEAGDIRQHGSKVHNEAVWHPSTGRATITSSATHGIHFRTIGQYNHNLKKVELLPEEALFLIERGNLECWTESGVPLSAQHAFTVMIGSSDLSLEKYYVYGYLKRLGYNVQRSDMKVYKPTPTGHTWTVSKLTAALRTSLRQFLSEATLVLQRIATYATAKVFRSATTGPFQTLLSSGDWWNFGQIFSRLRIIPTGNDLPLTSVGGPEDPWKVFYHVYKPVTKFAKTRPPPPDFRLAVVDARSTSVPNLRQLTALFSDIPIEPYRTSAARPGRRTPRSDAADSTSWLGLGFVRNWFARPKTRARQFNPYPALKSGRRGVVVALVDQGTISFLRYHEAEFGAFPLVPSS